MLECLIDRVNGLKQDIVKLEPIIEVLLQQLLVFIEKDAPPLSLNHGGIKFENMTFSYNG